MPVFVVLLVSCENKSTTTHTTKFMIRMEERFVHYLYTKFKRIDLSVQKLCGGHKIWKLGHMTPTKLTYGHFVVHPCTKFEADSSIPSKVITGSVNFEIWSSDPSHANLGVVLWSVRRRGPSSMSVPKLKRIALFLQSYNGSQKF